MNILHTADWHLGKKLDLCERGEEHSLFFKWLLKTICENKIDLVIVAGDIFDTGNPSNQTLKLYYDFLWQIKNTCCKEVVIVGGNHDSATTLNAPKDLLKHLNVHIVGCVPDTVEEQIIPVSDSNGEIKLVICAVPFLRDKDIRLSISGESSIERAARIKEGITVHYKNIVPHIATYCEKGIPVIATGHLYASGATTSDSEKEIHIGNLTQVGCEEFPCEFSYVALGHLHRPQIVNKQNHIRYSGSPIALSFSENNDKKIVIVLTFEKGKPLLVNEIAIPCYRRLIRIKGNIDKVKAKLISIEEQQTDCLPSWIEVQVETDTHIQDLEEQLHNLILSRPYIEKLFIKQLRQKPMINIDQQTSVALSLQDLDPLAVFQKKCESEQTEEDKKELMQTFKEALALMSQTEK